MNAIAEFRSRLPMPEGMEGIDAGKWRVLCEATFPSARTPEAVVMAIDYCRARGLDVFKRPVNIVPMWNSSLGREVETIWPGINEVQTTAARTGAWAGMDEPKWGAIAKRTFKGRKRVKTGWQAAEATVEFPEWCSVTVYRTVGGQRCAFTEPVYWLEAYSRSGGSELPTDMWAKRPRGQLHKVAKAASLRAAFPEEGEYTAEEMEGRDLEHGGIIIDHDPAEPIKPAAASPIKPPAIEPPHDPATGEVRPHAIPTPGADDAAGWIAWGRDFVAAITSASTASDLGAWESANAGALLRLAEDSATAKLHSRILSCLTARKAAVGTAKPQPETDAIREMVAASPQRPLTDADLGDIPPFLDRRPHAEPEPADMGDAWEPEP